MSFDKKDTKNFTNRYFTEDEKEDVNVVKKITEKSVSTISFKIEKKETKSKQIHLFLQPSIYEKIKMLAKTNKTSNNEIINIMIQYCLENLENLEK